MECSFRVVEKLDKARRGVVSTAHGEFNTPAFMPVGTRASVKGVAPHELKKLGTEVLLSNTYHLHVRPGDELIKQMGGLHKFMGWDGPILTDSGGYQAFSLSKLTKNTEDGVEFSSHVDGSPIWLDPEKVIQIQRNLGVDIAMVLDVCSPYPSTMEQITKDLQKTTRWAKRSLEARREDDNFLMFAIQQGGAFHEARKRSAEELCSLEGFDGYAIGGVSVGEPSEVLHEITAVAAELLPEDKPRYLMGVGYPKDIVWAVSQGVDMFDCVIPTRSARFGRVFVGNTYINIRNSRFQTDERPLEVGCDCKSCLNFSRAYISHLVRQEEMLGAVLCSVHNLAYYQRMMRSLRDLDKIAGLQKIIFSEECTEQAIF